MKKALRDVDEARQDDAAGHFAASIDLWREAKQIYKERKDAAGAAAAGLGLGGAYHSLGRTDLARQTLSDAEADAYEAKDLAKVAAAKAALGAVDMLSVSGSSVEADLVEAKKMAHVSAAPDVEAEAALNLGVLHGYEHDFQTARADFENAAELANVAGRKDLACKATVNQADTALKASDYDRAVKEAGEAAAMAARLPDGHEKSYFLINLADVLTQTYAEAPAHEDALRLRAWELLNQAVAAAHAVNDLAALSYAMGSQGHLYEMEGRTDEALALTRRALFYAEQVRSPEALYRWEWQDARLLHAEKQDDSAIAAYLRADTVLDGIRHDMSLHYGNPLAGSSYREVAGGVYFQLADLLLQKADRERDPTRVQDLLKQARAETEKLKSAEIEDYFQDSCVNLLKSQTASIENLSPTAAVIYIIPLPDRTELLVSLKSGIERRISPVTEAQLTAECRQFRLNLEDRTTNLYLDQAWDLYKWLITPIEPLLKERNIDTLVFIPDGALRTIPMAALNDGSKFLVEKYAVAVSPGLTLMQPHALGGGKINLIINGLSEAVQGFAPLTYVPQEVSQLRSLYGGQELLNQDFVMSNVRKEFTQQQFSIVHIASHGHFDSDAKKTFVLTFDSKLTLDQMEQLLRPSQLRAKPVELLTLSACQTAAGDDRAALGLAGVAIKAGARAAFATLWFVNDAASVQIVSDFYGNLASGATKADALRKAQMKFISDNRFSHPCYWAPYLIIGNWL